VPYWRANVDVECTPVHGTQERIVDASFRNETESEFQNFVGSEMRQLPKWLTRRLIDAAKKEQQGGLVS
jgi:hypothetical protein